MQSSTGWMGVALSCVLATSAATQAQYVQKWSNVHNVANLDDVGEDVAADRAGHVFSVGWVTNSATKTSCRLRVHDNNAAGTVLATKLWPPDPTEGFHKAHAVAIDEPAQPQGMDALTYIYIVGETPVASQGLDILVLRYIFNQATHAITGPVVRKWNSDQLSTGNDIGWDIELVGYQGTSGYVCVTGQSQGNGTGLDSITLGYLVQTFPVNPNWISRYSQGLLANRDDVTVAIARGPDNGSVGTVVVAGYSERTTDDFLVRSLDCTNGLPIVSDAWHYDTGYDERANAVVCGDGGGVFASGWTDYTENNFMDGPGDPSNKNYLTVRHNSGSTGTVWASIYAGQLGLDDIAYTNAYAEWTDDKLGIQQGLFVGGAARDASLRGADFRILRYVPGTGQLQADWWNTGLDPTHVLGTFNGPASGLDECFKIGVDWMGHVYATGRATRAGTLIDFGTVRFHREDGQLDDAFGPKGDGHGFVPFYWAGTANLDDQANAVAVHHGGDPSEENPDVFVTGFAKDTGQAKNIRTIKYEDHP